MYGLVRLGPKGWHAAGFALASGGRSADVVLLGVQNEAGRMGCGGSGERA